MNLPTFFRDGSELWSPDPLRRMTDLQKEMDRFFSHFEQDVPARWARAPLAPKCDVQEINDHYVVSMDIPGLKKEDIKIELRGNQLSVSGEHKEEKEETKKGSYRSERYYGAYARTFTVPDEVKADDIATEYKDGVLRVAVPKGARTKAKQIQVGEAKPGFFDRLFRKEPKAVETKEKSQVA